MLLTALQLIKSLNCRFLLTILTQTFHPSRYILILINDVILMIGTSMKEYIERELADVDEWNVASIFMGIGNILVWIGVLRYLGFFKTFNVVILTLKKVFTKILRFLVASLIIFLAYVFCGWLVLGPFQPKFRTLSNTSNCLFSLGDSLFGTFSILQTRSSMLWWFAQFYLYSFIVVYAYVVSSLFIAMICDAYDTIQIYYEQGFPLTDVRKFSGIQTEQDLVSGVYMNKYVEDFAGGKFTGILQDMFCGCAKGPKSKSSIFLETAI